MQLNLQNWLGFKLFKKRRTFVVVGVRLPVRDDSEENSTLKVSS